VNELERWGLRPSTLVTTREERTHRRNEAVIIYETQETGLRVDAEAAVTSKIMDRVAELDAHRVALAGNNATLDAVLMRVEVGFALKAEQLQRNLGSRFGL
jgi:hypothetical protein